MRQRLLPCAALLLLCSGCATIATLDKAYRKGGNGPLIMSGTRFNSQALDNRRIAEERFNVKGPSMPLADLPFSFVLDVVMLPYTAVLSAVDQPRPDAP